MSRKAGWLLLLFAIPLLAACSSNSHEEHKSMPNANMAPLVVEILTEAEAFKPGKAGKIEIKVTQGDEVVSDAQEVHFEIWAEGQEDNSETLHGHNDGSGIYSLEHTFEAEGVYYVIAHVTARDMHTMPKQQFTVKP